MSARPSDGAGLPRAHAQFDIPAGTIVELGDAAGPRRTLRVERRIGPHGAMPGRLQLIDVESAQPMFIDDEALAYEMQSGSFRVAATPDGRTVRRTPGPGVRSPRQQAYTERCDDYVKACRGLPRTRARIEAAIDEVAQRRGDPARPDPVPGEKAPRKGLPENTAPSFTTLLSWMDRWDAAGDAKGTDCFLTLPNPGNRKPRKVRGKVAAELAKVMDTLHGKLTAKDALKRLRVRLADGHPGEVEPDQIPGIRTIQRRISGQNRFVADAVRFGPGMAEKRYRGRYERPRPELPLTEVQCDFTDLDVILCDESQQIVFGKANAISFRCRCTGMCLGLSIGFGRPSYPTFLSGLRHAFYPKDLSGYRNIRNPWLGFGRFKRLYVDNELAFIGEDIRNAARELTFEIVEFRPGSPWLKGAEEKLQGDLNRAVSHKLPGATFSNIAERKLYEEWATMPIVTVRELRAYATKWICDDYHVSPHEGLGFLSTLPGIPNQLWNERIGKVKLVELPPDDLFVALAGNVEHRAINIKGIRWDHIRYQSDALDVLRTHPDHRNGREDDGRPGRRHDGTQYRVTRDPEDLGAIWVHDPHTQGSDPIRIPAVRRDYAAGLTLHQHKVYVANARLALLRGMPDPVDELTRAREDVGVLVESLMRVRNGQQAERKLARFLEKGQRHHERGVVSPPTVSRAVSAEPLDPLDPTGMPPTAGGNPNSPHVTRRRPPTPGTEPEAVDVGQGTPKAVDRGASRTKPSQSAEVAPADELTSLRERKRRSRSETPPEAADLPEGNARKPKRQSGAATSADKAEDDELERLRRRKRFDERRRR